MENALVSPTDRPISLSPLYKMSVLCRRTFNAFRSLLSLVEIGFEDNEVLVFRFRS